MEITTPEPRSVHRKSVPSSPSHRLRSERLQFVKEARHYKNESFAISMRNLDLYCLLLSTTTKPAATKSSLSVECRFPESGTILIVSDVLMDPSKKTADFKQSIEQWNLLYESDPISAIASVMSLLVHVCHGRHFLIIMTHAILQMCGCTRSVPAASLNDDLNDAAFLKPFQTSVEQCDASFGLSLSNKVAMRPHSLVVPNPPHFPERSKAFRRSSQVLDTSVD
jgi:hypothetical protein